MCFQVAHQLDHQPGFVSAHSAKRFVKKEKLRARCNGHRQLELAALAMRKVRDQHIRLAAEPDALDGGHGRRTQARIAGSGTQK